jgi:hypothetical protein
MDRDGALDRRTIPDRSHYGLSNAFDRMPLRALRTL